MSAGLRASMIAPPVKWKTQFISNRQMIENTKLRKNDFGSGVGLLE